MDNSNQNVYTSDLQEKLKEGNLVVCSVGAGYVGSLTSIVLAAQQPNLKVKVCDVNKDLIDKWNDSRYPFFEPNMAEYYEKAMNQNKNLEFTIDVANCIRSSDVVFICVNTPPKADSNGVIGKESDMKYFDLACGSIAAQGDPARHRILIEKSTVPVGTHKRIHGILSKHLENPDECFTIVSMPEFLAEGVAINNLLNPDRVVIGTPTDLNGKETFELIKGLYSNFQTSFIHVRTASSELGKLFANAMLAQRISSINSMTQLCETVGASCQDLSKIVGSDKRIGPQFLNASPAFGGSCFEKDLLSLIYILETNGQTVQANYWSQVLQMNEYQRLRLSEDISSQFEDPTKISIALFGFAFKKNTSDTRMTPVAFIVDYLIKKGFHVKIHDPQASERGFQMEMEMQGYNIAEKTNYEFCGSDYQKAVEGTSAIVIGTEWDEYVTANYREFRGLMKQDKAVFYDLRSIVDQEVIKQIGFDKVFKLGNPQF
eukprot:403341205